MVSSSVLLALVVLMLMLIYQPPAPSVYYEWPEITEEKPLCPGDTLEYWQITRVSIAPVQLRVARTIWDPLRKKTAAFDYNPMFVNIEQPITIKSQKFYLIPDLPAGKYQLLESATGESWMTAMFSVDFTIPEGCE